MYTKKIQSASSEAALQAQYKATRDRFIELTRHLEIDDYNAQTMPDVSPAKWHLAHTTWFFETFLLKPFAANYKVFHPQFEYLFNSYYNSVGKQYPRPKRGHMIRPTIDEVLRYRQFVDEIMLQLLSASIEPKVAELVTLGIHHEQQHQELFLTDIKHVYGSNPMFPAYCERKAFSKVTLSSMIFSPFEGGITHLGSDSDNFTFDNEKPKHKLYLRDFALANRLVTNEEYVAFIEDGAYQRADLWLSDGWDFLRKNVIAKPLYWHQFDGQWFEYTLAGLLPLQPDCPVSHVSFYEADAFARWLGKRLPSEAEWELAAVKEPVEGNLLDDQQYHTMPNQNEASNLAQIYGDVWEWTSSPYAPYPGFKAAAGAVGEYNGKFMCNQMTLRGGSCVTAKEHIRPTYRNFFYPSARWQFSGIRLAEDA